MLEPFQTATLLLGATASLAVVHALLGVDHALPFVALGRARGWMQGGASYGRQFCSVRDSMRFTRKSKSSGHFWRMALMRRAASSAKGLRPPPG